MIEAIIFDFDGMVYHSTAQFSNRIKQDYGIDVSELFQNEFSDCQLGNQDLREVLEDKYLEKWGWTEGVDKLLDYWFADGEVDQEMGDIITKARSKGIRCILATKNEVHRVNYIKTILGDTFDDIVASCEVHATKKDTEMFDELTKVANTTPDKILFCDDREENAKRLQDYGFKTHVYKTKELFIEELTKSGIDLN